jgi:hypothetical protein
VDTQTQAPEPIRGEFKIMSNQYGYGADMETVIRNVGEIDARDRQALEHVLGHALRENQQLVIRVVTLQVQPEIVEPPAPHRANGAPTLPEWCNVYEGLADDEIADILTFYNERIANQDYLRTADLPESVSHLIALLGYRPRPAIGASGLGSSPKRSRSRGRASPCRCSTTITS